MKARRGLSRDRGLTDSRRFVGRKSGVNLRSGVGINSDRVPCAVDLYGGDLTNLGEKCLHFLVSQAIDRNLLPIDVEDSGVLRRIDRDDGASDLRALAALATCTTHACAGSKQNH